MVVPHSVPFGPVTGCCSAPRESARRDKSGAFCPLERYGPLLGGPDPGAPRDRLYHDVLTYVGGQLHDDSAALLLARPAPRSRGTADHDRHGHAYGPFGKGSSSRTSHRPPPADGHRGHREPAHRRRPCIRRAGEPSSKVRNSTGALKWWRAGHWVLTLSSGPSLDRMVNRPVTSGGQAAPDAAVFVQVGRLTRNSMGLHLSGMHGGGDGHAGLPSGASGAGRRGQRGPVSHRRG